MWKTIDIVPSSIRNDPQVQAACAAIDAELLSINEGFLPETADPSILFWPFTDKQVPPLLDVLSWEMHVDIWQNIEGDPLTIEKKRELINESIDWHQHKGTVYVVEQMLKTVFASGYVLEWYQYGGLPYYFKIVTEEPVVDPDKLLRVIEAIYAVKNIRSWLDSFERLKTTRALMYVAVVVTTNYKNVYIPISINEPLRPMYPTP